MIWIILLIIAIITALTLISPLTSVETKSKKTASYVTGAMALFIATSIGLYVHLGTPTPLLTEAEEENEIEQPDVLAMVNGLAERLKEDPEDADGWSQLIRSRIVLGQSRKLIEEHKTMAEHYKDRPEIIDMINKQSGLNDLIVETGEE